jgi:hypothetical protein
MGMNEVRRGMAGLLLAVTACSQPNEPVDDSLPAQVAAYQYAQMLENRYFELSPLPDTCACRDTLVDSVWRVFIENGIYWAQSYRAIRHWFYDSLSGSYTHIGDENAGSRREGVSADSLILDPSLHLKLLVAPVQLGASWFVDDSAAISATIVALETLPLPVGNTRTWHVQRGAVGDEWWAPDLGRVQYDERQAGGVGRRGRLLAVGSFP